VHASMILISQFHNMSNAHVGTQFVYNFPSCHYHVVNILFNIILHLEKIDVYNNVSMKKICIPTVFHVKYMIALTK